MAIPRGRSQISTKPNIDQDAKNETEKHADVTDSSRAGGFNTSTSTESGEQAGVAEQNKKALLTLR